MPNIGPGEIIILLIIALVVFGPKKLPELGRGLGRGMRDFKDAVSGGDEDQRRNEEIERRAKELAAAHTSTTTLNGAPVGATTDATRDDVVSPH